MEYLYPPIYKYLTIFVVIFLFLQFYKQLTADTFLIIAILITLLVISLDYMMIYNQPSLLDTNINKSKLNAKSIVNKEHFIDEVDVFINKNKKKKNDGIDTDDNTDEENTDEENTDEDNTDEDNDNHNNNNNDEVINNSTTYDLD